MPATPAMRHFMKLRSSVTLSAKFATWYNSQAKCPFFNVIPPEIRIIIFELALQRYDDESAQPYPSDSYFSRPGYYRPQRIDTNLLATCRRIYLETYLVPVAINEHVFWCYRGPPHAAQFRTYFQRMTDEQRNAVARVHIFAQMYWLEGKFPNVCAVNLAGMRLKSLKLTIRHSDWWFWESNTRLLFVSDWGRELKMLKALEELELELEAIERDKDQLTAMATRVAEWQFKLHNGRVLSTAGMDVGCDKWAGSSSFEGMIQYSDEKKIWEGMVLRGSGASQRKCLVYHISTLKWRAIQADSDIGIGDVEPTAKPNV